ncbi:SDR family NAD(P)-dependent oxidoreductase [Nitrosovibrio tenuis]|uniref:NADP-dependent 3-hydroxy acid dehydrogenase YdfG n=1 Tax=Nitrosovibrio tenuis TaxID=1233 RepID=A0A1H7JYX6_9PROT|nr:SDR family NAD(P)-dependent oxidoreductase [Nitrosovibrio tenuis]SEK79768.1 NADP-dependent 3-hydroxy acid dehydrogenase YdfG [Nitrosovibrio tenuis]
MTQRIALVTGASSGIGRATAQLLADRGYYVFAGARRMDRLEQIRSANIEPIELDVSDDHAIHRMVNHIISNRGRIDVLVNNAGFGQLGTIECVSMEAAHRQFEVNVFGYARFMQAVLPHMRKQKSGHIVNITSVMGRISTPGFGWYAASKHAVEALSDAVRGEVMDFGIEVVLIAPGLIKTEFVPKQLDLLRTVAHPLAYQKILKGLHILLANEPKSPGPAIIAQAVLDTVTKPNPPIRYALPLDSKASVIARWLLGARLFARAVRHQMKLNF